MRCSSLNQLEELTMNVIVLAHNITDERSEVLESMPIDDIKSFCKSNGCKITKYYDDDSQLINDIKLKTSNLNVLSFGAFMKIILNCIDSAQSEKLNSLQYFQCWYNTFTTIKVNWEEEYGRINHITR